MSDLILGLDLASERTGVVLLWLDDREIYERDTIVATSSWAPARRCWYIAAALAEWVRDPLIVDIWAEAYGTRYPQVAMAMGRIHQAVAHMIANESPLARRVDLAYGLLEPSAIKLHATGKGNAKKPQMIAAAQTRWPGLVDATDDEADAAWIADLGAAKFTAAQAAQREEPSP